MSSLENTDKEPEETSYRYCEEIIISVLQLLISVWPARR